MADELLLHSKTRQLVELFLKQPGHALLICGPAGSGKETLAKHIAAGLVGVEPGKLEAYPYYKFVEKPDSKQEISIDSVRDIIGELKLKPVIPSGGQLQRIVLINGAQNLSHEAQSALLKAVEEPPAGTAFILTSVSDSGVLPTIASRAQKMTVLPVGQADARQFFSAGNQEKDIDSAWQLSQGAAGLMNALLMPDEVHPLKTAVDSAKRFLSMNRYERVIFLDRLSASREDLLMFLDALERVLAALHRAAVTAGNAPKSRKISAARRLTGSTIDSVNRNTSGRLAGLSLVLKLSI